MRRNLLLGLAYIGAYEAGKAVTGWAVEFTRELWAARHGDQRPDQGQCPYGDDAFTEEANRRDAEGYEAWVQKNTQAFKRHA